MRAPFLLLGALTVGLGCGDVSSPGPLAITNAAGAAGASGEPTASSGPGGGPSRGDGPAHAHAGSAGHTDGGAAGQAQGGGGLAGSSIGVAGAGGGSAGGGSTGGTGGTLGDALAEGCPTITGLGESFCVDGWCPLTPAPTPETFADALLFDCDVWVGATARQVVVATPSGVARLGEALPGRVRYLAGRSPSDLYVTVEPPQGSLAVWHFDGAGWSALPPPQPLFWRPKGLALSPAGSAYLLDDHSKVARYDGSTWTTIAEGLSGDWTGIETFAVVDDERMIGLAPDGDLVRWNAGTTTKLSVGWTKDWDLYDHQATALVALSFEEIYVGTSAGLFRVDGPTATLLSPGRVLDLTVDPTVPGTVAALVVDTKNNLETVNLLSFSAPGAPGVAETLPTSGGSIAADARIRRRGDRRLVLAPSAAHGCWTGDPSGWTSLYTNVPPWQDGWSWTAGASLSGASSSDFHVTWSAGVFHSDGVALTALSPLPPGSWKQTELLGGGPAPLFALGRESLAFASYAAGSWTTLPSPPIPQSTPNNLHVAFVSATEIFVAHAKIPTPGIRGDGVGITAESWTVVRYDGASWSAMPTPPSCPVRAIAALGNGVAMAATRGCGVMRLEQGSWTTVAGTEGTDVLDIAANAQGVCLATAKDNHVLRITGGLVETFLADERFYRLRATGDDFFGVTYDGLGSIRTIGRFQGGAWDKSLDGPAMGAAQPWSQVLVTADALFAATPTGDLIRRPR